MTPAVPVARSLRRVLLSIFLILIRTAGSAAPGQDGGTMSIKLFLIARGDAGRSGKKIGCDDSVIAVERRIPSTAAPLTAAIATLVSLREQDYGQSGLFNALAQSTLKVERVAVVDGAAEIRLSGAVTLGGTCDAPRFDAQIRETASQFPSVKRVAVFVNDVPLERVLSAR